MPQDNGAYREQIRKCFQRLGLWEEFLRVRDGLQKAGNARPFRDAVNQMVTKHLALSGRTELVKKQRRVVRELFPEFSARQVEKLVSYGLLRVPMSSKAPYRRAKKNQNRRILPHSSYHGAIMQIAAMRDALWRAGRWDEFAPKMRAYRAEGVGWLESWIKAFQETLAEDAFNCVDEGWSNVASGKPAEGEPHHSDGGQEP